MGHPIVIEPIRRRIVILLKRGHTYIETANFLGVGVATVNRVWRKFRNTGETAAPGRKGGRRAIIRDDQEAQFVAMIEAMPDATFDELTAEWNRQSEQRVSRSALIRKAAKLGFTRKKKSSQVVEKTTPKNRAKQARFRYLRKELPRSKLVFLDESGFQCKLRRTHARSICGTRAMDYVTATPSRNITIAGAIRQSGPIVMRGSRRSMTTKRFISFLKFDLLPRLWPGDIIVMDNLSAHRNKAVRSTCRKRQVRVVYLPPYCPEYNPIEKIWSWMKAKIRGRLNRAANCFRYAIAGAWRKCQNLRIDNLMNACGYVES